MIELLDASLVGESDIPNRDPESYSDKAFFELQTSILQTGGNIEPIKVRSIVLEDEDGNDLIHYEAIFGLRRLRACLNLGIPVSAIIVHNISDQKLLIERVSENSGRADFTALELGRICAKALDSAAFSSQKKLAFAFCKDEALISKALMLARLPIQVIEAFQSRGDLQYRHAKPLDDAMREDRDAVLLAAAQLAEERCPRAPAEVLRRLTAPWSDSIEPFNRPGSQRRLTFRGSVFGTLDVDSKGFVTIKLKQALDDVAIDSLEKAVVQVVGKSARTQPAGSPERARRRYEPSSRASPGVRKCFEFDTSSSSKNTDHENELDITEPPQ